MIGMYMLNLEGVEGIVEGRALHSPTLSGQTWPDNTIPRIQIFWWIFLSFSGHCPVIVWSFSGSFSDWTICLPDFPARQSSGHDQKD